ncbi:MAG TPA: hypothetical protein VN788_10840, partial [Verrucomicrobiae bacterium]|nr:hypothetical protein [Verrucomicrobiae bacterium]
MHELAHELLHGGERRKQLSRKVKETEAEAVAYAVGLPVGLDMNTASAHYISLYDGDRDTLRESLDSITRVSSEILQGGGEGQGGGKQGAQHGVAQGRLRPRTPPYTGGGILSTDWRGNRAARHPWPTPKTRRSASSTASTAFRARWLR